MSKSWQSSAFNFAVKPVLIFLIIIAVAAIAFGIYSITHYIQTFGHLFPAMYGTVPVDTSEGVVVVKQAESISDLRGQFGTLGDVMGGLLNPILTFISILLLLWTIRQTQKANALSGEMLNQARKQLEISADELRLTRDELAGAKEAQQDISVTQKLQQFENTFFTLLKRLLEQQKDLQSEIDKQVAKISSGEITEKPYSGYICNTVFRSGAEINSFVYFAYKVVSFVNGTVFDCDSKKKEYVDIVSSSLNNNSLFLLFLSGSDANPFLSSFPWNYRETFVDYSFFDRLDFLMVFGIVSEDTFSEKCNRMNDEKYRFDEKYQGKAPTGIVSPRNDYGERVRYFDKHYKKIDNMASIKSVIGTYDQDAFKSNPYVESFARLVDRVLPDAKRSATLTL